MILFLDNLEIMLNFINSENNIFVVVVEIEFYVFQVVFYVLL